MLFEAFLITLKTWRNMRLLLALFLLASRSGFAQDGLEIALQRIYQDYQPTGAKADIPRLVLLDQEMRYLILEPWEKEKKSIEAKYFRPEYVAIGLSIGHYSDALQYSGKLLLEAHQIDPASLYRKYTLFSTIIPEEYSVEPPNIDSAKAYLKEFPAGPYIFEVVRILAELYDDLYKAIRGHRHGAPLEGELLKFFSLFISTRPLEEQLSEAQLMGLEYYNQAIQLRPSDQDMQTFRDDLKEGTTKGWFFLPD